eukprot:TRINITY_DN2652_c1_g1_i1.p1 TRINITY_DN2652_c1_g1~~TRINITY_DN2652_c1_g1_i1.p1  ORF type:complete len:287 (+),score=73.25 TRINITY_DN2652_c1_g1_i1:48-908(+)
MAAFSIAPVGYVVDILPAAPMTLGKQAQPSHLMKSNATKAPTVSDASLAAVPLAVALFGISKGAATRRKTRMRRQATMDPSDQDLARRSVLFSGVSALVSGGVIGEQPAQAAAAAKTKEDQVVAVVDGDTVKLSSYGRCRLIGVNTPETVSPKQKSGAPPDCYGPEASALTKKLLPPGTKVRVELDSGEKDKYDRELVYLYRAQDDMFVNAELVKEGAARRMKVAPNVKYDDLFVKLEKDASSSGKGLWKACSAGATPAQVSSKPAAPTAGKAPANPGDVKNCTDI